MPPTPTTPRLASLDPNEVASEACETAIHQATKLAAALGVVEPRFRGPGQTMLGTRVAGLTRWAQTGEGMPEQHVAEAIHFVVDVLYSRAAHEDVRDRTRLYTEVGEPRDAVSCVILAALARRTVRQPRRGRLVSARWLAALASVAESRVHQVAASGELRRVDQAIQSIDARRWLQARGVPGF